VNLMTAGRGIVHSERSPAGVRPGGAELSGIQTWLALPRAKEEIGPRPSSMCRRTGCRWSRERRPRPDR
jgi:redox-sensitive bicupin YhaK (pirin superfamily)